MRATEVLLREHVKDLGKCGDVVRVAPGFARNFLIPKGMAIQATAENKKAMIRRRERLDAEEIALLAEVDKQVDVFSKVKLSTEQRTDDHGRLYGSVNAHVIAGLLEEAGYKIEEKNIRLEEPIKQIGDHRFSIHLHAERSAEVLITVLPEGGVMPVAEAAPAMAEGQGDGEAATADAE